MNKFKNKKILIGIYSLILMSIVGYLFITNYVYKADNLELSYSTFLENLNNGKVEKVYLTDTPKLKGVMANGQIFYTDNPRLNNLKETLLVNNVVVDEVNEQISASNLLTFVLLIGAFVGIGYYLSKQGMRQTSKEYDKMSSIEFSTEKDSKVSFGSIAGNEEAKENMIELVDFLKQPEKYERYGARMPKGVILYGPPGTGKTLMAKALASEAGVDFIAVSGSDFVQVYAGLGAGRIRNLFKKAREKGKCVIFIDEIDAIGKKRDRGGLGGSDESDRTLNALLTEMSGFKGSEGIIIMAATNRLDILDEALLRPGRFDRQIEVGLPDLKARKDILSLYVKNRPMSPNLSIDSLAQQTVYFSGAKIENLINEAAIYAAKENAQYITEDHLDRAFYTVVAGEAKKDRSGIKKLDKRITAYHEAGHAAITKLLCPENKVTKVTIIPSTKGAGGFSMNIPPDRMYHTKVDMLNNIKVSLGGRVVEELVFGEDNITTGASNDIQKATEILTAMIKQFGMNEKAGMLNYDILQGHHSGVDGELRKLIMDEMKKLYDETKTLLEANINLVKEIAEELLIKETLNEEHINEIFDNYCKQEQKEKCSFCN
ncbi:ATP-dependent metallopeptidase FtsH/Yme1/Tma family protein [Serpentinicella alkaliphila]|uniref:ATP-dependent zinc metalloprotease FtsH n=1 Tax=Serpentinicella alkaliphila TaxID=1734049 RepID=A0A4R2TDF3_9FIRM|nr:FtsH/Yme1/Tma family ATP-dependent metallopeptidase [Serpentinicella alkaliphila]QUH26962.1 ATP-dependent metallopeptidase FtsH/Yme1/Tma family protein [Serpentinicella alkaliphila]TCQ00556.1 membrane protease FtsH catalytic subunit [Serpentinicella alkaliphila]